MPVGSSLNRWRQWVMAGLLALMATPAARATTDYVLLGNLFDDGKSAELADAMASDGYGASAATTDLGVQTVITQGSGADFTQPLQITPLTRFNFATAGGGNAQARPILNDAWGNVEPIRTLGNSTDYNAGGGKVEEGIGVHANNLITFNLDELRAAGAPRDRIGVFSAHVDQNDDQAVNGSFRVCVVVCDRDGAVMAAYINGVRVDVTETGGVYAYSGTIPGEITGAGSGVNVNAPLPLNARFLTLASVSGNVTADHCVFSNARIDFAPVIPLGNLFDDAQPATPTGTELWNAVQTDTYKAAADTTDLGVDTRREGGLNAPQTIAGSGLQFDFSSAGGAANNSNGAANDSIGSDSNSRPPLRTLGTGTDFPARPASGEWGPKIEDGIGLHANSFVTFDLTQIRQAGGLGTAALQFHAKGAINDSSILNNSGSIRTVVVVSSADSVLAGYVNGETVAVGEAAGVWSFTGALPAEFAYNGAVKSGTFDVLLTAQARYLTLAATGGTDINTDHTAFSGAELELLAVPTTGTLFVVR